MRLISILCVVACFGAMGCKKKSTAKPCPTKYHDVSGDDQKGDLTCSCKADESQHGTVWGTSIFTTDSSICSAAIHVGVLAANAAGDVTVRKVAGCDAYVGSKASGVTSQDWPKWDSSFYFPSKGDGKCPPAPAAAAAPPAPPATGGSECPATWDSVANADTATELTCNCSSVPESGSVWGTGVYTSDSSICRAAVHAGVFDAKAGHGQVKVKKAPGCSKYTGTAANGITTDGWGSHGASFYFDGKGDGKCAS